MSHLLHVFPLTSLHELTPIIDAYQWNAHDHFKQTIKAWFPLSQLRPRQGPFSSQNKAICVKDDCST